MTTRTNINKPANKRAARKPAPAKAALSKVAKAVKGTYTVTPEDIKLAKACGAFLNAGETNKLKASENAKLLHKHGAVIGKYKECPLANNFIEGRFPGGKNAKGTKVSAGVIKVILSAFRTAVKTGKGYDENASRTKARANSKDKGDKVKTLMIAFPMNASAEDVATKLRAGFNRMKEVDALSELASYLLDALNDAGHEISEAGESGEEEAE